MYARFVSFERMLIWVGTACQKTRVHIQRRSDQDRHCHDHTDEWLSGHPDTYVYARRYVSNAVSDQHAFKIKRWSPLGLRDSVLVIDFACKHRKVSTLNNTLTRVQRMKALKHVHRTILQLGGVDVP